MLDFHDCTFLNEEEVFALGPGVFGCVAVDLSLGQKILIFLIQLEGNGHLLGRNLALIQEKVIVNVFIVYLLFEEIFYFFEIG